MPLDPRTPVLVGVGAVTQRADEPADALEAVELMAAAARAAGDDSGRSSLLRQVQLISVPEGTWSYPDPGRLIAARIGVSTPEQARTLIGAVGVTQQAVIADACHAIASGAVEVALVVGGEARDRAVRASQSNLEAPEVTQPDGTHPDRRLEPATLGIADLELIRNAATPSTAYALIDQARRHHLGRSPQQRQRELGARYAPMAALAAANPDAWDRTAPGEREIVDAGPSNRMIASPYTKRLCSQWNVDQAAALLLCSYGAANAAGVATDRMVFPWSSAVSDHAVPVLQRPELWRSPNVEAAVAAAMSSAGISSADDIAEIDCYSCFPVAIDVFADALGLATDRAVTVTGGMSFAGGPLNNYVLQALVVLAGRLRAEPAAAGFSSSVSGFLTKAGAGIWSATPPQRRFAAGDCTAAVEAAAVGAAASRVIDAEHVGAATVASWTVDHLRGEPHRAVVFLDTPNGGRTMASSGDAGICAAMLSGEWIGTVVDVAADGSFRH